MKDCDKIFLVYYVGCAGLEAGDINSYLEEWYNQLKDLYDESVKIMFIPNGESKMTRVEILNPKYISKNQYKKSFKQFDKAMKNIEEIIKIAKKD